MAGINDSLSHARQLAELLRGRLAHVNLIPMNPVEGSDFTAPSYATGSAFEQTLRQAGVPTTLRVTRGREIDGACGQLRAHALRDIAT